MDERSAQLQKIYRLFDAFVEGQPKSCKPGCTACCTRNVTMTALEGRWVLENLNGPSRRDLFRRLLFSRDLPRFQPSITLNGMAELLDSGRDLPEEGGDPSWGPCPLLEGEKCTIYAVRPFMCRSMVSEASCRDSGYATVKPVVLTTTSVLLQVIEHLDAKGFSGNLIDVFLELGHQGAFPDEVLPELRATRQGILGNRLLRRLKVPREHRDPVQALLERLDLEA